MMMRMYDFIANFLADGRGQVYHDFFKFEPAVAHGNMTIRNRRLHDGNSLCERARDGIEPNVDQALNVVKAPAVFQRFSQARRKFITIHE
jgi:hypothetical protein